MYIGTTRNGEKPHVYKEAHSAEQLPLSFCGQVLDRVTLTETHDICCIDICKRCVKSMNGVVMDDEVIDCQPEPERARECLARYNFWKAFQGKAIPGRLAEIVALLELPARGKRWTKLGAVLHQSQDRVIAIVQAQATNKNSVKVIPVVEHETLIPSTIRIMRITGLTDRIG